mmetsp:Transcript_89692/g.254308  ORF Transcript_89692/g.254308 Transcript_89692/m.254308 type:complete len:269 (-) Transcript_89692:1044-1850(-)
MPLGAVCPHDRGDDGRRVVGVVRGHVGLLRTPGCACGWLRRVQLHPQDGQGHERRRGLPKLRGVWERLHLRLGFHEGRDVQPPGVLWPPLDAPRASRCGRPGLGTVRLERAPDVLFPEVVEQAVGAQHDEVTVPDGRGADGRALDHSVRVRTAQALEALHLDRPSSVVAPRLGPEDGPQAERSGAARPQHHQRAVAEACRHEARAPEGGQEQRRRPLRLRGVICLLDEARDPGTAAVGAGLHALASPRDELRPAALEQLARQHLRRNA